MSETPTINIPLGFKAPNFLLKDTVSGNLLDFSHIKGSKGTVVIFICNHCPYVIHVIDEIVNIAKDYLSKGIQVVAISSNDVVAYPQDAPEKMTAHALKWGFDFPYLFDEHQEVAKAYQAACTPDYNVFNEDDLCVYRGQLDDSRPGNNIEINGRDLRLAIDYMLDGKAISENQKPSTGCNIKWKNGDVPLISL